MNATSTSSNLMSWVFFLISLVAIILMLMYVTEFFWVVLPFVLTYLVKALNAM